MLNENFIAIEPKPTDVKSALEMLKTMVRARSNADLLLKMGEIQGAYAIYERTGDVKILEHIIVEIIKLFNNMLSPEKTTRKTSFFDTLTEKPTDLIYYKYENSDKISVETLIEDYLNNEQNKKERFSDNTRYNYETSLKKVFNDMGIQVVTNEQLHHLKDNIKEHMKNHPEYNHNIKSAVNGFIKYLFIICQ